METSAGTGLRQYLSLFALYQKAREGLRGPRPPQVVRKGVMLDRDKVGSAVYHPLELVPLRFDIRVKYLYARALMKGRTGLPRKLYWQHLNAWNGCEERIGGKVEKTGFRAFDEGFRQLLDDLQAGAFDWERSPVPVIDGYPVNGSHRIAACLCLNRLVHCRYEYREWNRIYLFNEAFFRSREGLGQEFVDTVNALYMAELAEQYGSS